MALAVSDAVLKYHRVKKHTIHMNKTVLKSKTKVELLRGVGSFQGTELSGNLSELIFHFQQSLVIKPPLNSKPNLSKHTSVT